MTTKEKNTAFIDTLRSQYGERLFSIFEVNGFEFGLLAPTEGDYAIYIDRTENGKNVYFERKKLIEKCICGVEPSKIFELMDQIKGVLVRQMFDALEAHSVGKLTSVDVQPVEPTQK